MHYDNASSDVGEGVEIAGPAGTNLACFDIIAYNGNGGGSYITQTLSGTIPDEGCGYGTIWFPISGLQNGAPDGIALYNTCTSTLISFISYEGTFTASNGPANGTVSTNIGVNETSSTPVGQSLQLTGSGNSESAFAWSSPSAASPGTLNAGQSITPCGTPNTITTGTTTGGPFSIDCTTGANGTIAFTATGTFNTGNTFTVQLSDNTGSFASPIDIGSFTGSGAEGTDPSGIINMIIPALTASGTGYQMQIVSSDPGVTSGNSTGTTITLTTSCTPPHITSVIINSCNGICPEEGYNELVFGTTGDYTVEAVSTNMSISYGTSPSPTTSYTDVLITNPTTTAAINTAAGCPGNFVEGTGVTMPPNSSFILADGDVCIDALTWSGLCGLGPIYIIYQNDPNWSTSGNFSNSTSAGTRYFNSTFTTTTGDVFSIDYEYDRTQNTGTDGDFVTFSSSGGAPTSYGDDDCTINPIVLPAEMLNFEGEYVKDETQLFWRTATEINTNYFEIRHSVNGSNFVSIGTKLAAGNSQSPLDYRLIHSTPPAGMNYYWLLGYDFDGSVSNHGIISINVSKDLVGYDAINSQIIASKPGHFLIYAADGRLIQESMDQSTIPFYHAGIFLIVDAETGNTQKIVTY